MRPNHSSPLDAQPLIEALERASAPYNGRLFFQALAEELTRQIGDLGHLGHRIETELSRINITSSRDEALGVLEQRAFLKALSLEFQRTQRYGRPLSILMLSVDQIEAICSTQGETVSEALLYEIAGLLRKKLRSGDLICRMALEGFVMVLPETGTIGAKDAAEKIAQAISDQIDTAIDGVKNLTTSIGVAVVSGIERNHEEILSLADRALAQAKTSGGNRICSALGIL